MGSEPRVIFIDYAQEARLGRRSVYYCGKDGTVTGLLLCGFKVIQSAGTLSENYLPVLEVNFEEISHCVEGHRVVLSHYGKIEDAGDTFWVEPRVHVKEGLVFDLFGQPHTRIGVHNFLGPHCINSCQEFRVLEQVPCRLAIDQDPYRWYIPLSHLSS